MKPRDLAESIAAVERLLESPWLLDDEEEREFLEASLAYDREVLARAYGKDRPWLN